LTYEQTNGITRGANFFRNPVYKCPEIRPKIYEIKPEIFENRAIPEIHTITEIPVICDIKPKISEIWLKNLEIRKNP